MMLVGVVVVCGLFVWVGEQEKEPCGKETQKQKERSRMTRHESCMTGVIRSHTQYPRSLGT